MSTEKGTAWSIDHHSEAQFIAKMSLREINHSVDFRQVNSTLTQLPHWAR